MGTTSEPSTATTPATSAPTDGTAVAAPADDAQSKTQLAIGSLPDAVKAQLTIQRQRNIVAAQIAGTNWGKGLDLETRRALADWANRAGIDPATELNVLGGSFYKNAYYYMRRLSEMADAKMVVYAYVDHVEVDARLVTMANRTDNTEIAAAARAEIDRRTMMRIQYAIPDKATGASIFHIMLTTVPHEFSAAKWCGGGTRAKDPVGDEFPVETSETRSIRRTMRLVALQNPAFKSLVEPNDDDSIDAMIGDKLREGLLRAKQDQIEAAEKLRPKPLMQIGAGDDPYGLETVKTVKPEKVPVEAPASEAPLPTQPPLDFQDDRDLLTPAERAAARSE